MVNYFSKVGKAGLYLLALPLAILSMVCFNVGKEDTSESYRTNDVPACFDTIPRGENSLLEKNLLVVSDDLNK